MDSDTLVALRRMQSAVVTTNAKLARLTSATKQATESIRTLAPYLQKLGGRDASR